MENLKVATIQTTLEWENKKANFDLFDALINPLQDKNIDVIVLPEMFTTGFSMQPEKFAEKEKDSNTLEWLKEKARESNAAICGSFIIKENGNYFNRLYWVQPDGVFFKYDKRHLFSLANEHEHYTAGKEKIIVTWRGWKICTLICYDLRFPVWSRNTENYDLLIYVANWPERRSHHWKSLLVARAIENQSYCIGVNRIGFDGNQIYHSGDSTIVDFEGNILYQKTHEKDVFIASLSLQNQMNFRAKFPFLDDKDIFLTNI
jgi:omega-amidase